MSQNFLQRFSIKSLIRLFLSAILLLITSGIFSQERIFTNEQHFSVEEGLPQSYISGIIQDDDGFIWLSTLDGFSRYDGRVFRTFRYDPKDSSGLAINTLSGLGKLHNNIVTIYYSTTLAAEFNLRTFTATPNTIRHRLAKIPGIRWQSYRFGYDSPNWFFTVNNNKGIGWLNGITGKIHYANTANGKLHTDTISAITQSAEGKIYLISENGVQVSDKAQTKFEWYGFNTHLKQQWSKLEWDVFGQKFSIVSYPRNRVAMLEKDKFTILDIDSKSSRIITLPAPKKDAIHGNDGLQVDAAGRVYFEYYGRIYRLTEKYELELLWEHSGPPSRISAFFIDRSDVLWLSLNAQGLLKIDLLALHFESYRYRNNFIGAMTELMGSNNLLFPDKWLIPDAAYYFRQAWDNKGNLYSCNGWYDRSALFQFTPKGFQRFTHLPQNKFFSALVHMEGDEIWGFDQSESVWYKWNNHHAVPQKSEPDSSNFAGVELADARFVGGYIWMSTYSHGLFQFDGRKIVAKYDGSSGNNTIPNTLTEICIDPLDKNKFWVGSRGGGLVLWDSRKGLQRTYTTEDGLPNNTIYCILPDKNGRIWCSTNKGIFRLDPATGHVIAFEKTDGLQGNEFNRAHKFLLPDGRMVFGGLDGYTIFNPDDFNIAGKRGEVPVLLTGLQINNEPQDINIPGSIIKESLSTLSVLELPYDKNYLRFEFAALLYNQPQKTKYRYQLAGADKGWIENNYSNVAAYSALAPGKYTFRINATDNNGLWSDTYKEIKLTIHPPYWATW
ncbi:MAG: triple tyrosine motif-containing protein, partial [Ginsengibacter sp.]